MSDLPAMSVDKLTGGITSGLAVDMPPPLPPPPPPPSGSYGHHVPPSSHAFTCMPPVSLSSLPPYIFPSPYDYSARPLLPLADSGSDSTYLGYQTSDARNFPSQPFPGPFPYGLPPFPGDKSLGNLPTIPTYTNESGEFGDGDSETANLDNIQHVQGTSLQPLLPPPPPPPPPLQGVPTYPLVPPPPPPSCHYFSGGYPPPPPAHIGSSIIHHPPDLSSCVEMGRGHFDDIPTTVGTESDPASPAPSAMLSPNTSKLLQSAIESDGDSIMALSPGTEQVPSPIKVDKAYEYAVTASNGDQGDMNLSQYEVEIHKVQRITPEDAGVSNTETHIMQQQQQQHFSACDTYERGNNSSNKLQLPSCQYAKSSAVQTDHVESEDSSEEEDVEEDDDDDDEDDDMGEENESEDESESESEEETDNENDDEEEELSDVQKQIPPHENTQDSMNTSHISELDSGEDIPKVDSPFTRIRPSLLKSYRASKKYKEKKRSKKRRMLDILPPVSPCDTSKKTKSMKINQTHEGTVLSPEIESELASCSEDISESDSTPAITPLFNHSKAKSPYSINNHEKYECTLETPVKYDDVKKPEQGDVSSDAGRLTPSLSNSASQIQSQFSDVDTDKLVSASSGRNSSTSSYTNAATEHYSLNSIETTSAMNNVISDKVIYEQPLVSDRNVILVCDKSMRVSKPDLEYTTNQMTDEESLTQYYKQPYEEVEYDEQITTSNDKTETSLGLVQCSITSSSVEDRASESNISNCDSNIEQISVPQPLIDSEKSYSQGEKIQYYNQHYREYTNDTPPGIEQSFKYNNMSIKSSICEQEDSNSKDTDYMMALHEKQIGNNIESNSEGNVIGQYHNTLAIVDNHPYEATYSDTIPSESERSATTENAEEFYNINDDRKLRNVSDINYGQGIDNRVTDCDIHDDELPLSAEWCTNNLNDVLADVNLKTGPFKNTVLDRLNDKDDTRTTLPNIHEGFFSDSVIPIPIKSKEEIYQQQVQNTPHSTQQTVTNEEINSSLNLLPEKTTISVQGDVINADAFIKPNIICTSGIQCNSSATILPEYSQISSFSSVSTSLSSSPVISYVQSLSSSSASSSESLLPSYSQVSNLPPMTSSNTILTSSVSAVSPTIYSTCVSKSTITPSSSTTDTITHIPKIDLSTKPSNLATAIVIPPTLLQQTKNKPNSLCAIIIRPINKTQTNTTSTLQSQGSEKILGKKPGYLKSRSIEDKPKQKVIYPKPAPTVSTSINFSTAFNRDSSTLNGITLEAATVKGTFCVDCNKMYETMCTLHNMQYRSISDAILTKARSSLPAELTLRSMYNQDTADYIGVLSRKSIPSKTKFGPLYGKKTTKQQLENPENTAYVWEVFDEEHPDAVLDCRSENDANWLMFVKRARSSLEQNMLVYQEGHDIYFITIKDIEANVELLYWYGRDYAVMLGVCTEPEESFRCQSCHRQFPDINGLRMHIKAAHPLLNTYVHRCNECGKVFKNKSILHRHQQATHVKVKSYICPDCGKGFSDRNNQRRHTKLHTENSKAFKCDVCGRTFSQKTHLIDHMAIHSEERNFPCRFCDKRFSRKQDSRHHEKTVHIIDKEYSCEKCSAVFYSLRYYKVHIKTHQVKEFKCPICAKEFTQKVHLKTHLARIHSTSINMMEKQMFTQKIA